MKKESLSLIAVKTILAIALFAGVGTVIMGGMYLAGKQGGDKPLKRLFILCKNNSDCPSQMKCRNYICVDVGCLKEGENLPGAIDPDDKKHMATKCCRGLESIEIIEVFSEDCMSKTGWWGGSGKVCSNCGNRICEEWESKCNCPEDCE